MKILSKEVRDLLDKLYNLRGEDSVILKKMNEEKEEATQTQERTKKEKETLLQEIDKLTKEEKTLAEEGNKLISVLENINRSDFAFVLDRLNIDFDPAALNAKVTSLLPQMIADVGEENKRASEKLENVEIEMSNAITKIEELGIRKDEALSNQNKLNDIFNLALSGNINITREEITSLLEKFAFNEEERREAAKILMFPEDALYDYENSIQNGQIDNLESVDFQENIKPEKEEPKEKIVQEPEAPSTKSPLEDIFTKVIAENTEIKNEEAPQDNNLESNLEGLLSLMNLTKSQFKEDKYQQLLTNFNESIMKENIEVLQTNGFDYNIVLDNVEILYDKELKDKITKLLNIGKEIKDINLVPSVLIKYDLDGLNNTINVLQISGLDPKKVPLMAY